MALKTRQPTGRAPWPLILVEGPEKSGKSFTAALFSASSRIGQTYWIDLGEGSADEYGAIQGARYLVVEHDGTWQSILSSVEAIRDEAARVAAANQPPVVLVIDSMTAEWDLHKDWASNRAKARMEKKGRRVAPDADVQISMDLWNDANSRHRKLMTILMTFPGVVVITARGKDVAALDANGRPIEGSKEYKVEGQKTIAFDATVWVRMSREQPPLIVGARSVHAGVRPGVDRPKPAPNFSLEWLVFDVLRCNPAEAAPRALVEVRAGAEDPEQSWTPEEEQEPVRPAIPASPSSYAVALFEAITKATSAAALRNQWDAVGPALQAGNITKAEADQLTGHIRNRKAELEVESQQQPTGETDVPMVTQQHHRRMHALWRDLGLGGEQYRERRLARTAEILGLPEPLESSARMTAAQADAVIHVLDQELKEDRQVAPDMAGATS
jgi:hypothetical protein